MKSKLIIYTKLSNLQWHFHQWFVVLFKEKRLFDKDLNRNIVYLY